ncbi:MAG TPA: GH92 family glycosyl hydrolase [Ktedonobacteraceae bacterium]|nr:GH92 family glycosyl hydrolase [Ktedonobacteraceae bacterium]
MQRPGLLRSKKIRRIILAFVLLPALLGLSLLLGFTYNFSQPELTSYVNPFIGTAPGGSKFGFSGDSGDVFPGATYPAGMMQWSPDTTSNIPGGYNYADSTIKGFSLTHFSGRGCTAYQDIPFMPYVGSLAVSPAADRSLYQSSFSHNSEYAHPGYYQVHLNTSNVEVALSVTERTGIGQFTYPASKAATMLINAGGSINGNSNAGVTIIPGSREVTGFATSTVGCGSNHYTLYFAAQFDRSFMKYGTWNKVAVIPGSITGTSAHTGAYVAFDTTSQTVVQVKVGISFVSIANAQANLAAEQSGFNFISVRQHADAAWNSRLGSIVVQGGSSNEKTTFYTALYHASIHPNVFSDDNRQYIGFDGKVHTLALSQHAQYENVAGWDQYRSLFPLLATLFPTEASDIAQSLVNDAQQGDGHLPRWEQANADSRGMNGDGGSVIVAEAYAFGARNFDTAGALKAMLTGQSKIRNDYNDYLKYGYVTANSTGFSAAITQEYTVDDFAIAQFAKSLGDTHDYQLLLQRANNWQNIFNIETGYMQPRNSNGSWVGNSSPAGDSGFQEGSAAQYTWMEQFNLRGLFAKMGGNRVVVSRLDTFFTRLNDGPNSAFAFMGNEPSFEVPWEYDFAGAPSHTQEVVRRIQLSLFKHSSGGLPGNDDGGAMSSWYVFSAIGLYPEITGVGGFVIGSPLFSSITLHLSGGHTVQINAPSASDASPYVQSLQLNGSPTTSLWLPRTTVQHGATLDFALGNNPTNWGSSAADAPPSY